MRILVLGNINSGKSFIINELKEKFDNYTIIQLDDYRKKYSDGSINGEQRARQIFVENVLQNNNCLVEFTGLGELAVELNNLLHNKSYLILETVYPSVDKLVERIDRKKFDNIPYPFKCETIEQTIYRLDKEIENQQLGKIWKEKSLGWIKVEKLSLDALLLIKNYSVLYDVCQILINEDSVREIITFGSLARYEVTPSSDFDLALVTTKSIQDISRLIYQAYKFDFWDIIDNKITLYKGGLLIEIFVVKSFEDIAWFYYNSNVDNIKSSIIKGGDSTKKHILKCLCKYSIDTEQKVNDTIKRVVYFILSLQNIMDKNDEYKFVFHSNIIVHELLKLLKFIEGDFNYDYLPKNTNDIFSYMRNEGLLYHYSDKKEYINTVANFAIDLLGKFDSKYIMYKGVLAKYLDMIKGENI